MMWRIVAVAAVMAVTNGQIGVRYDGSPVLGDARVVVPAPVLTPGQLVVQAPEPVQPEQLVFDQPQQLVLAQRDQPQSQQTVLSQPLQVVTTLSTPQSVQQQLLQLPSVPQMQAVQFVPVPQPTLSFPVFPSPAFPRSHPLACGFGAGSLVHARFNNREYHFSWCRRPTTTYSFQQAQDYCTSLPNDGHPVGFHALSIEDETEDSFISNILHTYRVRFIWTSGTKVASYAWKWQSSVSSHYTHWSHTGRFGRPQPDNADGQEDCLAILNNFYGDGITWHDIQCHFDKYVICERPRAYGSSTP